jgi:hypothetical protein
VIREFKKFREFREHTMLQAFQNSLNSLNALSSLAPPSLPNPSLVQNFRLADRMPRSVASLKVKHYAMKRALLTIQFMLMCCCAFASPVGIENIERYGFWCLGPCIVLVLYHILRDIIGYRVPPWLPFKVRKLSREEARGEQPAAVVTDAPQIGAIKVDCMSTTREMPTLGSMIWLRLMLLIILWSEKFVISRKNHIFVDGLYRYV